MKDWLKLIEPHRLLRRIPAEQAERIHQRAARELGRRGRITIIPYLFLVLFMLVVSADVRDNLYWHGPLCIGLLATSIVRFLFAKHVQHAVSSTLNQSLLTYAHLSVVSAVLTGLFTSIVLTFSGFSITSLLVMLAACGVTGAAIGTMAMFPRLWTTFIVSAWAPIMLTCCVLGFAGYPEAISLCFMIMFYGIFVYSVGHRVIDSYWQGQINLFNLEKKTDALEQALSLVEEKEHELRDHHEQLQALVKSKTKDLLAAKEEAERANEIKSEFLSNMTHELRTPVHAILSFSRFGLKKLETESRQNLGKYFTRIEESGNRLIMLVDDVLDLAKFEASRMQMKFKEHDINALIRSRLDEQETRLLELNLHVDLHLSDELNEAVLDEIFIGQVVTNLLSNAMKFSKPNDTISISTTKARIPVGRRTSDSFEKDAMEIIVRDQGIGIPESELETIFEKFAQSTRSATGVAGTGLGLAICREIIELHHGLIWAESRPNDGTEMHVLLPLNFTTLQRIDVESSHERTQKSSAPARMRWKTPSFTHSHPFHLEEGDAYEELERTDESTMS